MTQRDMKMNEPPLDSLAISDEALRRSGHSRLVARNGTIEIEDGGRTRAILILQALEDLVRECSEDRSRQAWQEDALYQISVLGSYIGHARIKY